MAHTQPAGLLLGPGGATMARLSRAATRGRIAVALDAVPYSKPRPRAGGPDYGVRFTLEGAPSKLRLGGVFPWVTDEL